MWLIIGNVSHTGTIDVLILTIAHTSGQCMGITWTESSGFSIPLSIKQVGPSYYSSHSTRSRIQCYYIQQAVQWFWVPLLKDGHSFHTQNPPLRTDSPKQTYGYSYVSFYIAKSHKNVFRMKTSTCRDEMLKNQPNKMGTTPQHIHTIPTSCAILPTMFCVC